MLNDVTEVSTFKISNKNLKKSFWNFTFLKPYKFEIFTLRDDGNIINVSVMKVFARIFLCEAGVVISSPDAPMHLRA